MNPDGQFNKSNADLKIRSSDGVVFDLHRVLLSLNTGTFPGPEFGSRPGASASSNATGSGSTSSGGSSGTKSTPAKATTTEMVDLTEPANVLRVCFDFVYPKRHPDLEDITDFTLVNAIAEAVGKYEIYAGMNTCNMRLRAFLPKHATEIFLYAIKHDHSRLLNEAIPYLARASLVSTLKQIPSAYMVPWSQYHEAWSSIFKLAIKQIKAIPVSKGLENQCHVATSFAGLVVDNTLTVSSTTPAVCDKCRCSLLIWVSNLEEIDKVDVLKAILTSLCEGKSVHGFSCCKITTNDTAPSVIRPSITSSWSNTPTSAFGSRSTAAPTSVFGVSSMPTPTSAFGASSTAAPTSAFGAASTATPASAFGAASTATPTSAFGASSTAPTSAFGASATAAPTSAFGTTSTAAPTSAFGTTSTAAPTSAFGASSTSAFGAASTAAPTSAFASLTVTSAPTSAFASSSTPAPVSIFSASAFSASASAFNSSSTPRVNVFGTSAVSQSTPCCGHAVNIAKFLLKKIEDMPSFNTFLAQRP